MSEQMIDQNVNAGYERCRRAGVRGHLSCVTCSQCQEDIPVGCPTLIALEWPRRFDWSRLDPIDGEDVYSFSLFCNKECADDYVRTYSGHPEVERVVGRGGFKAVP